MKPVTRYIMGSMMLLVQNCDNFFRFMMLPSRIGESKTKQRLGAELASERASEADKRKKVNKNAKNLIN